MNGYTVLIDLVVVAGAAAVVPAALGRWWGWWALVAASAAVALSVDVGAGAAILVVPWLLVALAAVAVEARPVLVALAADRRWPSLDAVGRVAAPVWATVAGVGLLDSCAGWDLSGVGEPITRLTAVHFTYAGVATTALALAARRARTSAGRRLAVASLVLVLVAPPVVALGFLTGAAVAQVGGAVLMTAGAYLLALVHLGEGWRRRFVRSGRLLLVSGLSVWAPMALAVAWALARHTDGPALSIPDLVRIHGGMNALGFVGCALAARWLDGHRVVAVEAGDSGAVDEVAVPVASGR